jgi:hypothetical protein
MNTYNPITRAAAAAWAELTTPEAVQWYSDRAWNDTLTTTAAFHRACVAAIHLGAFCRCLVEDWLAPAPVQVATAEYPAINPAPCAGYLPAAADRTPAPHANPVPIAPLHTLSVPELRQICAQRGIAWNRANNGKHLSKKQMVSLLSASPAVAERT